MIPAATLEAFPTDLSDHDARSTLAAWSVLWHPLVLAKTEQVPVWYRADSPPDPIGKRLFAAPHPSLGQLPSGYQTRAKKSEEAGWITGDSRSEMVEQLLEALEIDGSPPSLQAEHREISVEDFFAIGYVALQVQVMTRRLRYTSNLDEIHLQSRIVAAAKAFLDGQVNEATEALHDVFDCLAEERDHYFSSDPHLIDLVLTSTSTLDATIQLAESAQETEAHEEDVGVLETPINFLIDFDVANAIRNRDNAATKPLREALSSNQIGWAGGAPPPDLCLDTMTMAEAQSVYRQAYQHCTEAIGVAPTVFGRFSGTTPHDITPTLVGLGYHGMIPLDFANGTGHGDEAKVILQCAGTELEALTVEPIDALSDASFLALGAKLGEAIDSGEIATALLAHWPGQACQSFLDLKRAASWSLSLGRFWNLDAYFREGEHPYHHGAPQTSSSTAAAWFDSLIEQKTKNPISSLSAKFREQVQQQSESIIQGMTELVCSGPQVTATEASTRFAQAIGAKPHSTSGSASKLVMLVNPQSSGSRHWTPIDGVPKPADHVFATSHDGKLTQAAADVPSCGFVVLRADGYQDTSGTTSIRTRLKEKLFGGTKPVAQPGRLQNEFLEMTISEDSGGISGVYSGSVRGNRFSMRLVGQGSLLGKEPIETVMRHKSMRVVSATECEGVIETTGELVESESKQVVASFTLRYSLLRGQRFIKVEGNIEPSREIIGSPWQNYFAARAAVADEGATYRAILRDKVQRSRSRRIIGALGVVIDESQRQTLVGSAGLAIHRRLDDRFLDTLLQVAGETNTQFELYYGFDVTAPVAAARTLIVPPKRVSLDPESSPAEIGWIVHCSPSDILLSDLTVKRRDDGRLAAIVRVIQTRPQSCKASLRFVHDVDSAFAIERELVGDPINAPLPTVKAKAAQNDPIQDDSVQYDDDITPGPKPSNPGSKPSDLNSGDFSEEDANCSGKLRSLKTDGDGVSLTLPGHGTITLLVLFDQAVS